MRRVVARALSIPVRNSQQCIPLPSGKFNEEAPYRHDGSARAMASGANVSDLAIAGPARFL